MYLTIILASIAVPMVLVLGLKAKDHRRRERDGASPNSPPATPANYR